MDTPDIANQIALMRTLPRDEQAELATISSMLFSPDALIVACEMLVADDFFRADYRAIFSAIADLANAGVPADAITLKAKLEERDLFERVGGAAALVNIAGSVSTAANIRHYAKIVAEMASLRRLIGASENIAKESYEAAQSADIIMDNAEAAIFAISQKRHHAQFAHISEALDASIELIDKAYKVGSRITGVASGFMDLDNMTAGFHPGDLILIAARPSMGKTALALNIVAHAAIKQNVPCAVFSLEMEKEQLANRMLASEALIDAGKLRTGQLDSTDWTNLYGSLSTIAQAPIYIDDTGGINISYLRSKCRKLKMDKGLGLIMIDYLQLMSGSGNRNDNRQNEISEISRSLKALAREMQTPVIALSQLNRSCETRTDRRPMLSDLRESGAIEQDADLVAFIFREDYYFPDTEKRGQAEIIIAKQRNGETGSVILNYQGNYVRFVNAAY